MVPDHSRSLVYLPGLDGTGRLLHRQTELLQSYQTHCLSFPQDAVHSYSDLVDLAVDALEGAGGGTVLAESFGGAVALMAALRRPALIQRMILVNTFAYFPRSAIIGLLAAAGRFLPAKPSHPASRPVRGLFFFSPDIPPTERQEWWERTAGVPMHAFGRRFALIAELDLRPRLTEIHIPTLVVAAPDDRVVPACAGKTLARLLPNARLIAPRVGHAALIHTRVNVAELLREPNYWPSLKAAEIAACDAGSRSG
jgi:pimeloyl-ACP methyl ester carboxylesterase